MDVKDRRSGGDIWRPMPGDRVSAMVEWPGGRRTTSEGTLIRVVGDKAYIDTPIGAVEADLETMVKVDG